MQFFNLGESFIQMVKTLYNDINSSVKMCNGMSSRFCIRRGIHQGCPIAPLIFILSTQVLALLIEQSPLKGITIGDRDIKNFQLADDTIQTLFVDNKFEIAHAFKAVQTFSKYSGLCLNLNKCELFSLKDDDLKLLISLLKKTITYLGIVISKNQKNRSEQNYMDIINKIQKRFNIWFGLVWFGWLSIHGRVLLSKAEGLSRAAYMFPSLEVPKSTTDLLDRRLFNIIWTKKAHLVRKDVLKKDLSHGGLNVLDFTTLNQIIKINWIKNCLKNPSCVWYAIPNLMFNKLGGLNFLLKCPYKISKLPIKLSAFHQQSLLNWLLIYKHNFSPHRFLLWTMNIFPLTRKPYFLSRYSERVYILFSIYLTKMVFCFLFPSSAPRKETSVQKHNFWYSDATLSIDHSIYTEGIDTLDTKCNNQHIKYSIQKTCYLNTPTYISNIRGHLIWALPHKYVINNKI
uniref:Reverse transcriptase domain-containing protein n=1 Tax=Astyanax mexicanus TaxID=7994 RepID=A0A3B1IIQ2_ASTMX